jgi:hypothetical protein
VKKLLLQVLSTTMTCAAAIALCTGTHAVAADTRGQVVVSLSEAEISGITFSRDGRMFLTLPRVGENHRHASVVEMVKGKPVEQAVRRLDCVTPRPDRG